MESYYFVEKDGSKHGPYKLSDLKDLNLNFDQQIWRSDNDQWKKASEFEELREFLLLTPPLTPIEKQLENFNQTFISNTIGQIAMAYIFVSLIIGLIASSIAETSWKDHIEKYPERNNYSNNYSNSGGGTSLSLAEATNPRYRFFTPNSNNEDAYARGQGFWFRPLRVFGGTLYLTSEEQRNTNSLSGNLMLSSFVSMLIVFIGIALILYFLKRHEIVSSIDRIID